MHCDLFNLASIFRHRVVSSFWCLNSHCTYIILHIKGKFPNSWIWDRMCDSSFKGLFFFFFFCVDKLSYSYIPIHTPPSSFSISFLLAPFPSLPLSSPQHPHTPHLSSVKPLVWCCKRTKGSSEPKVVTIPEAQTRKWWTSSVLKVSRKENNYHGVKFGGSHASCHSVFCAMREKQGKAGTNQKSAKNWRSQ